MIAPVRLAPNSPLNSPLKIKEAALPRLGFPSGPSLVAIGGRRRPERLFTIELTKSQGKSALGRGMDLSLPGAAGGINPPLQKRMAMIFGGGFFWRRGGGGR